MKEICFLPSNVLELLQRLQAPARLIAHLTLVHDVAVTLTRRIDAVWPCLQYDRPAVLIGAATHDIGKAVRKKELVGPGKEHEEIGRKLLLEAGYMKLDDTICDITIDADDRLRWQAEYPVED